MREWTAIEYNLDNYPARVFCIRMLPVMLVPLLPQIIGHGTAERRHPHDTGWRTLPYALLQVIDGGPYRVRCEGRPALTLDSGAWFIAAGVRHRVDAPQRGAVIRTRWIHLRCPDANGEILERAVIPLRLPEPGFIINCFDQLAALTSDAMGRAEFAVVAGGLLVHLLSLASPLLDNEIPSRLQAVASAVQADLAAPWHRDAMAKRTGLSATRLHTVWCEAFGLAPSAWVRRQRIRRAQELLYAGDDSVAYIAEAVGFADPFHFTRCFTAQVGQSPSRWRSTVRD
jgi:AraC-like DNA-binding protein